MPVDFLSAGHQAAYGRYSKPPSAAQLQRFFHFDERDRALIDRRRGDHNRLGFAVQLGTVRFLGTFLARPTDVPQIVAARVAEELRVDPGCVIDYAKREPTHREHAGEIQREYGYRDASISRAVARSNRTLGRSAVAHARASSQADSSEALMAVGPRQVLRETLKMKPDPLRHLARAHPSQRQLLVARTPRRHRAVLS